MTRKLTLDYGLRWDYQTYMTERAATRNERVAQHPGRNPGPPGTAQSSERASCNQASPSGVTIRVGIRIRRLQLSAYQIDTKTVLRVGLGIQYDVAGGSGTGVVQRSRLLYRLQPERLRHHPAPEHREPAPRTASRACNAYAVGNPFGNIPVVWPNLNQDKYPIFNNGIGAPSTPAIFIDPHNRPGRIFTWSIALQREVTRGLGG